MDFFRGVHSVNFYVYRHARPDGSIFYVGKGKGRRARAIDKRSPAWRKAAENGFSIDYLAKNIDEDLAFLIEREAIDVYRRRGLHLVNISAGDTGCSGYRHTPEHIARLKGNAFGAAAWGKAFKGRTHSDETKRIMSEKRKGVDNGKWKGKKRSLESRMKMSAARKGKPLTKLRRLTDEQVREIRSTIGYRQIALFARRYGVGESTIRRIVKKETLQ